MKYGIIDVGGGLRGIYGAGVLDRCLEENVHFDCCIGVSAGSANMTSYVAGQKGRNKPFYDEYSFRKEVYERQKPAGKALLSGSELCLWDPEQPGRGKPAGLSGDDVRP